MASRSPAGACQRKASPRMGKGRALCSTPAKRQARDLSQVFPRSFDLPEEFVAPLAPDREDQRSAVQLQNVAAGDYRIRPLHPLQVLEADPLPLPMVSPVGGTVEIALGVAFPVAPSPGQEMGAEEYGAVGGDRQIGFPAPAHPVSGAGTRFDLRLRSGRGRRTLRELPPSGVRGTPPAAAPRRAAGDAGL